MKASTTDFDTLNRCPHCGRSTDVVKLGAEPAREICLCGQWDGVTLE